MKLMIVESPNKVSKISKLLGCGWKVSASVGHIRDLPSNDMGFTPPYFKPQYVVSSDKKKVVSSLKGLVASADTVYLATDPDREGEAIAFHLEQELRIKGAKRVVFNEVTASAINKAVDNAGIIDYDLVRAQEARRVLDRIVGYIISAILSEQSGKALSAGRVQSPTVKLVVLREKQIQEFRKRNFYVNTAEFDNGNIAELDCTNLCENGKHIFNKDLVEKIALLDSFVVKLKS